MFDETYQKAIEAKQIEKQRAAQKQYELQQAKLNAEIAAANAKGEGDAARERARGEADATRTRGDAESYYNQKVTSSITEFLIKQQYLKRWDGKLPVYMMGEGSSGVLLQLPAEGAQTR